MLLVEQRLHFGEFGMESKRPRAGRSDGQQTTLRQCQYRADLLVGRVPAAAQRDDHIVAVVAAKEEDADQGLVILGALRQSIHQSKPVEAGGGESRSRGAASPLQKVSSRKCHGCFSPLVFDLELR